jgi:chromosome partitioning protein
MKRVNPTLRRQWLVINMLSPRVAVGREIVAQLRRQFDGLVCSTTVPRRVSIVEATIVQLPVVSYEPRGPAAESYRQLAAELLQERDGAR